MKKMIATVIVFILTTTGMSFAESIPFSEWIEGQGAVAEQAVVQDTPLVAEGEPLMPVPEDTAVEFTPIGVGSRGETVAQLQAKLIELGILNSKADGIFGPASEAAVKYTQKALGWEETGVIQTVDELNTILALVPGDGVNLAVGTSDEWSEWMSPAANEDNRCFVISAAYPGEKELGDPYTCQIEIEFAGVTATGNEDQPFKFYTQGRADGEWEDWRQRNAWNVSLIEMDSVPEDGVYRFAATQRITEQSIETKQWDLGFRCDNWASGQFRVRCVKVEKGIKATEWTPAP